MQFELKTEAVSGAGRIVVRAAMDFLTLSIRDVDFYELELALTEAVNNVVEHSHPDNHPGELRVRIITVPPEYVQLEVSDRGQPFEFPNGDVPPHSPSGRGVGIMRRVADDLHYRRQANRNTVTMRKNIKEEAWKVCK